MRSFSLSDTASMPSVSMTTVLLAGSLATKAPDVHEACEADVLKGACSWLKKHWHISRIKVGVSSRLKKHWVLVWFRFSFDARR